MYEIWMTLSGITLLANQLKTINPFEIWKATRTHARTHTHTHTAWCIS